MARSPQGFRDHPGGGREIDTKYTLAYLTRQCLKAERVEINLLKDFDNRLSFVLRGGPNTLVVISEIGHKNQDRE